MCTKPFSQTKNKGKLFLVAKSSGPHLHIWKPRNDGQFLVHTPYEFSEVITKCLWPCMDGQDKNELQLETWRTFSISVLVSCKTRIIKRLVMVCIPCENSLDISLLVFLEHFVCEWRHLTHNFSKVLMKCKQNHLDTAPLILLLVFPRNRIFTC